MLRIPLVVAALLAVAGAPARAQFPFGGPPGGPGGDPMADLMERVAFGTIEDANPVMGYLQVGVPGRGSRIVVAHEATTITRMAPVALGELKVGDEVTVAGAPTVVVAEKVQVGAALSMMDLIRALQEGAGEASAPPAPPAPEGQTPPAEAPPAPPNLLPAAPGAPGPGGPPSGGGAPASVTLTGQVKSVEPLVVTLPDGSELAVQLPEGAPILRRAEADLSAVVLGDAVVAVGQVDADGYLAADRIYLGESISMGRSGGRGGRGGGGFGGFGGGFGGPPMGGGEGQ